MGDYSSYFKIFPDFPNIMRDSKTSVLDLENLFSTLTKDERDNMIDEYIGLGIIEPCKKDEYIITSKGWKIWNKCK